ncbi:MAG: precorrin-6Y C5,15-methyltransferase subunit CbiT [Oscillatoriales cyanobacterium SM2_2_1]|nr:precorrin-6Y C5,15-methyltransferase subunit CbiT [Oscillatoriales cyanobacterium SM2_2_1]
MTKPQWNCVTPGIPDELFERLPGIPMSKCEVRLLILGHLRLRSRDVFWDIGAGTGTIPVEVGVLCPDVSIVAIERDGDVAELIRRNCDRFGVGNIQIVNGSAPECLADLHPAPQCICVEGGRSVKEILEFCWPRLADGGRVVVTTTTLEGLYSTSECFARLCVRHVQVVQSAVNRLETRGNRQTFAAVNPMFLLCGDKVD